MPDGGFEPLRLNLGAGDTEVPGFTPIDRKLGQEVYPLDVADDSVDEIRASHVLEHFSHREVADVVKHWVQKLVPGGRLRVAVPDFYAIAQGYIDGRDFNVVGYTFGGQVDEDDYHKCGFDEEVLTEIFLACGLERISRWSDDVQDCSSLDISLNMECYKPLGPQTHCERTTAVLSAPRFGIVSHFKRAMSAFGKARVPYQIAGGAYWHQVMSELMAEHCQKTKYVITCDYDTQFEYTDVLDLYRLMEAYPHADAIAPLEQKRNGEEILVGLSNADGSPKTRVASYHFHRYLMPIQAAHFGLTIFRSEALRKHAHPWMEPIPNDEGRWGDGRIDADMNFWVKWREAGNTLYLAPKVVIGHVQEMIAWPGQDLLPVYQTVNDYEEHGKPQEVKR